ncbi:MAG: efflux RND transporter permease subunit [Gemmataceae bacterium]
MIPRFFIDRPIFAAVLSIIITLTGAIALGSLPIAQYPQITPPSVQVSITYPGASAQVVADTVAAPIEQQVNGVEGMLYMSSQMGNDGSYTLTVTFDVGTDLNTALVMVQNRVTLAIPQLPSSVQRQGITVRKKTPDILLIASLFSSDGRYDDLYLSNYALVNLRDELLRVDGVSDINIFGERDYSVRAWLDPQKLAAHNMTAGDVAAAIRSQNVEAALGRLGQPPAPRGQTLQLSLDTEGRLATPEEFGNIIVKVGKLRRNPQPVAVSRGNATNSGMLVPGAPGTMQDMSAPSGSSGGTPTTGSTGSTSSSGSSSSSGMTTDTPQSGAGGGGTTGGGGTNSGGGGTAAGGATTGGPGTNYLALGGASLSSSLSTGAAPEGFPRQPDQGIVRLRDVARVEMGAQNYNMASSFDGGQTVGLAIHQLPDTNALDVADRVRARLLELKERFPEGVDYTIAYDITPFIRDSVQDVVRTLFEAVGLVALVVLVFLQSWRAMLIPLIAVPVAIVGTFAVMAVLNFSLNNISLFGLVLAIGIVVDDAIVVVENVERWLERGESPHEATRKAMDEVTGPVIAVALVLCAVFVPCAFISGITGQFFRQFAVTIAVSTAFSAINSLTLSPALAAILLRPRHTHRDLVTRAFDLVLGWFFRLFNAVFGAGTSAYAWVVGKFLRMNLLVLLVYAGLLVLTYWTFLKAPTGFVPQQDQGRILVSVQLPDAASLERTQAAIQQAEQIARDTPGVAHTFTISGMSFVQSANGPNFGSMFVILDPFEQRQRPDRRDTTIMRKMQARWQKEVKEAQIIAFPAPPIPGLSVAGGYKVMVEDRAGMGLGNLQQQTDRLTAAINRTPGLAGASTQFRSNIPQLYMDIDRTKAAALGVPLNDVNQALQMYLGSVYVNSFNAYGRYWQVTVQAEGQFRSREEKVNLFQVRNKQGQMVPLGTLVTPREIGGPAFVTRYNLYTAAAVSGNLPPGASTGEAIAAIDNVSAEQLPRSMKTEWTELMFMQIRAGNTAIYVFALAVVCVFLALAALYESWTLPLAVILVVPLCLLCSVAGTLFAHNSVNIFVQIGLVVLVGLACKNAILIVEFAKQMHRDEGKPRFESTVEASRLRLRPILMTSFAFILGVVPLVIASGAGSEMRRSLGTAVFSGMLGVTLFGVFLTPVFFYVLQGLGETRLMSSPAVRWLGSAAFGAIAGAALGLLLWRAAHLRLVWALVVGGLAGTAAVLLVMGIHRRVRKSV